MGEEAEKPNTKRKPARTDASLKRKISELFDFAFFRFAAVTLPEIKLHKFKLSKRNGL